MFFEFQLATGCYIVDKSLYILGILITINLYFKNRYMACS
jgi:hypothetical protein